MYEMASATGSGPPRSLRSVISVLPLTYSITMKPSLAVRDEVVDADDVGVLDRGEVLALLHGDLEHPRILGVEQALQDDPAGEHRVEREVDPAEPAEGDGALDLVLVGDHVAGLSEGMNEYSWPHLGQKPASRLSGASQLEQKRLRSGTTPGTSAASGSSGGQRRARQRAAAERARGCCGRCASSRSASSGCCACSRALRSLRVMGTLPEPVRRRAGAASRCSRSSPGSARRAARGGHAADVAVAVLDGAGAAGLGARAHGGGRLSPEPADRRILADVVDALLCELLYWVWLSRASPRP